MRNTRRNEKRGARGITLIEMLVVLAIIALFASLVAPRLLNKTDTARVTAARAQINAFMTALGTYKRDTGVYPATELGLEALRTKPGNVNNWQGPYLPQEIPVDPWGRTNVPGIFAIGDVTPGPQLAHRASAQGIAAVETAAGHNVAPVNALAVPACTYTEPEANPAGVLSRGAPTVSRLSDVDNARPKWSQVAPSRATSRERRVQVGPERWNTSTIPAPSWLRSRLRSRRAQAAAATGTTATAGCATPTS